MENYGWEDYGGKHYESGVYTYYQGWILPNKFGYDKRRMHLSTLVCSGQMSRDEALKEMSAPTYPLEWVEPDKTFVAKKLGISREEFDAIMAAPEEALPATTVLNLQNHWAFGPGPRSIPGSQT